MADIGTETERVGNALTSVRLDEMVTSLAKGIAWGQYDLDKVGVDVTKMMGVPGAVNIGEEKLSMLETGFLPTFYQFVDTIMELKMEIKVREERMSQARYKDTYSRINTTERGGSASASARGGWFSSYERSQKTNWKNTSKAAYSRSVDAAHATKYGHELNASSLVRTKIVPRPAPDILVERISLLLEQIRKEVEQAKQEVQNTGASESQVGEILQEKLMTKIEERLLNVTEKFLSA